MRSGFWVVLGLVGAAPTGALAQVSPEQPGEQAQAPGEISDEALQQQINELWQGFRLLQQEVAALREQSQGLPDAPAVAGVGGAGATSPAGEAAQEESSLIIVELPAREDRGLSDGRSEPDQEVGIGGSGQRTSGRVQGNMPAGAEVYVGTVRTITGDTLLMKEQTGRIYELGVNERTRVIGLEGERSSLNSLAEGTPVRAVATEGGERAQVHTLYILVPTPVPER